MQDERFEIREGRPGTGKGLFAREAITKGAFIAEYTGSKMPSKEAESHPSRYLFELDSKWTLDGETMTNDARWINHSCDPNTEAEIEKGDDGEKHINIYAMRKIEPGEEITIDYGQEYFDEFIKPIGCRCGAKKHRK